ncbi:AAA family ATPase, partial [Mycoplasmopsis maculosa]|uniref:AAA family ATPase n=1 Tax=Mycoplasmopsis maculosa TaxID=114885 RepID=UPI00101D19FC
MKLIKVEAHGFKSFADPIVLKFDGGVAGIVGPNGSGKSNINDAIKWVLGERSAKELRGDNMEDVIFAGSKTAKPMQKAVVTLTFDNRDGLNDHPHEFITISRSVERGTGNNQYYLNGEECRYRDIKELAMESGIGKSSLAIISQGTVSDIAEATVDERKLIFEEAAGVSKYKFRKKEAQTKLDKTEEGLEKIRLVISEIERKLIPLRKQAEKAKLFIAKSEELKGIEIGLLVDRIKFFGEQYQSLSVELEGVNETKSDLNQRIKEAEDRISENIAYKNSLNSDLSKMIDEYENIKSRINSLEIVRAREEEKAKLLSEGKLQVTKEEEIKAYESFLEKSLKQLKFYENQSKVIQDRILNTKTILENHDNELNALNISVQKKKTELATVQSHIQLLKQQIESNSMLFKGTKTILENKVIFGKSLKGTVAELISVDSNYALAIEAVLNNALQHIVVDKSETAVKAVNFLKSNKGGRATFIPLASIQPKSVRDDHLLAIQGHPGFVGIANDLIKIDKTYDLLAKFLLGNIIVATDIDQANKMSHILDNRYMIVTLDGDTIRAGGVIMGGTKNTNATLLTIEEKLKELEALIPNLNTSISINEMKIREIANKRRSAYELKSQLENQNLLHQNDWRNEQARFDEFNEKLKNISNRELNKNSLDLNKESNESDYETLLSKRISLEADINSKRVSINTLSIDIDSQTK